MAEYTVTVTDDRGTVIFVGRPLQERDYIKIHHKTGVPVTLECLVSDLSAGVVVN